MNLKIVTLAGVISIFLIVLGVSSSKTTGPSDLDLQGDHLVVLELFTSQGCSSCPAAEAVLSKLAESEKYGATLIPLAFHVDYWNYLGWVDPYSSPEWTNRQSDYREVMGGATLYTPQLVMHGQHEMIGSDETRIKRHVDMVLADEESGVFTVAIESATFDEHRLIVDLNPTAIDTVGHNPVLLVTAVYENARPTEVANGENAGRTLGNKYVVRALDRQLWDWSAGKTGKTYRTVIELEPDWVGADLGVAAWVQDALTMKIFGADIQVPATSAD